MSSGMNPEAMKKMMGGMGNFGQPSQTPSGVQPSGAPPAGGSPASTAMNPMEGFKPATPSPTAPQQPQKPYSNMYGVETPQMQPYNTPVGGDPKKKQAGGK